MATKYFSKSSIQLLEGEFHSNPVEAGIASEGHDDARTSEESEEWELMINATATSVLDEASDAGVVQLLSDASPLGTANSDCGNEVLQFPQTPDFLQHNWDEGAQLPSYPYLNSCASSVSTTSPPPSPSPFSHTFPKAQPKHRHTYPRNPRPVPYKCQYPNYPAPTSIPVFPSGYAFGVSPTADVLPWRVVTSTPAAPWHRHG